MALTADQIAKLKQIETTLLAESKDGFKYYFMDIASNNSGMGASGEELNIHLRLLRLGLTHDLFDSQDDYNDWRMQMMTRHSDHSPENAKPSSSSTAAPEKVSRTSQRSIFQDEKSIEKPAEDGVPDAELERSKHSNT